MTNSTVHCGNESGTRKNITAELRSTEDGSTVWFDTHVLVTGSAGLTRHRIVNHEHTIFVDGMTTDEVDAWLKSNRKALNDVASWNRRRKDEADA